MGLPATDDLLDLQTLAEQYRLGRWTVAEVISAVMHRIRAYPDPAVWISILCDAHIQAQIDAVEQKRAAGATLPLYGVPFAVKDNIDVAHVITSAGCPDFAYLPKKSATVVQRLCDAGAIVIGKTNLDQFATGLTGVRSPYGACRNPFDSQYISGGSSSGSAVAVATGLVSFALGTDTAGSGRVPAGFNNIVGLKPSKGLLSTAGVFPACRSLDCVSIFALTCEDGRAVFEVAQFLDPADPFAQNVPEVSFCAKGFRFGVPQQEQLQFFGDSVAAELYENAIERLKSLGGEPITIDFEPFAQTARLLYEGPWVAERLAAVEEFLNRQPESMLPITRAIIERGKKVSAVDTFRAMYELESLRTKAGRVWDDIDLLFLPTAGTIYTIEQVLSDPITLNTNLGYYTNFANLLDLCAVAVPNGFAGNGLPHGVTFLAPAGRDRVLTDMAGGFHRESVSTAGAMGLPLPPVLPKSPKPPSVPMVRLAVVGAHLSGQPLNWQLTDRGGKLVRTCRTAAKYRLVALPGTVPPKPGMFRVEHSETGAMIEVEVWELSNEAFGSFVAAIPPPLGIGTIELEDGEAVKSFVCEGYAVKGAADISSFGGWRGYLASRK